MKVVSAVRRRCKDCKIIRRKKKIYVKCDTYPRHKQRQGFCTWTPLACFSVPPKFPEQLQISTREMLVLDQLCSNLIR